jgi:3-hydroxyisobutyrate dehydrogenase
VPPFAPGAVWAQMGTIGVTATTGLASRLGRIRPDVTFVDAPVSGSKGPAEAGQLLILASGPAAAEPVTAAVFAAIGRKTVWLGAAGQGSRMKLVVNTYLSFPDRGHGRGSRAGPSAGHRPGRAGRCSGRRPLDAPLADAKLHKIAGGDFTPEFPLEWALKDVDLAIAAGDGASLPMLAALSRQWHSAVEAGYGRSDVSAARLALGGPGQLPVVAAG